MLIDYRNLRDIRVAHALECRKQCGRRPNAEPFAGFLTLREQIAQIAMRRTMNETLLRHPEVVVHLRKIFVAGIDYKTSHSLRFRLFTAVPQSSSNERAGR